MEPITIGIIVVLTWFGVDQYGDKKEAEAEVVALQTEIKHIVGINNDNSIILDGVSSDLDQCVQELETFKTSQADFNRINESSKISIEELEVTIHGTDWGSTRIPDSLDF